MDNDTLNEHTWTERFCQSMGCPVGRWYVAPHPVVPDSWYVIRSTYDTGAFVAAIRPLCPVCGGDLLTLLEIEGGLATEAWPTGPLFDFARAVAERVYASPSYKRPTR